MQINTLFFEGARPYCCSKNVEDKIVLSGGSSVFGWDVRDYGWYRCSLAHCVWRDPEGELWDVTPRLVGSYVVWPDSIEFMPDDAATIKHLDKPKIFGRLIHRADCPAPKYELKTNNRHLKRCLDLLPQLDAAVHRFDLDGARYYADKANRAARQGGQFSDFGIPDLTGLMRPADVETVAMAN